MERILGWLARACFLLLLPGLSGVALVEAQEPTYKNLQVLPADISEQELDSIMLGNLRGLGLPRLAGEGCLFCHEGDLDTPRTEWDYASDAKPMKAKARVMLAMVRTMNGLFLPQLENRVDENLRISCATCHAARTDPRPLQSVLWAAYEAGGIDSVVTRYRVLRARYFGGDAYDFRIGVLIEVAMRMANGGAIDDAITLADLNAERFADRPAARRAWVQLRLEKTIDAVGVEAALEELSQLEATLGRGVVTASLLDNLGWRLMRSNRETQARAVLEANVERFPDSYVPLESIAWVLADSGEREGAFELIERWLERFPNHARARQFLINLRGG